MGECIGVDFGTTYSVIAKVHDQRVEAVSLMEGGNGTVDSIVAEEITSGRRSFGLKARNEVKRSRYRAYKGFKMLLSEEDNETGRKRLEDYGFGSLEQPAEITEFFLRSLIEAYQERCTKGKTVDRLVVGVPEVWFNTSINSRSKLEEIASKIVGSGKVQLESEPKLACAYFVHSYKQKTGKDFSGNILLIDYGGGTLDIALCNIRTMAGKPDISILYKTGAGANEQKIIGNAGLAFQENVVNRALAEAGIKDIVVNNSYYECVHEVENQLLVTTKEIKEIFEDAEGDPNVLSDEFWEIRYDGQPVSVTYRMLLDAFHSDEIYKVFGEKLAEVKAVMDQKGIDYRNESRDDFKIALVGGFCNFYLTQKQVQDTEGLRRGGIHDDRRYMDFDRYLADGNEREKAVAYGAALLANGDVTFQKQAPYSLFLLPFKTENGVRVPDDSKLFIVFNEYDELEFDKPYMVQKVKTNGNGKIVMDKAGKPVTMEVKFRTKEIPFIRMVVGRDKFQGQPSEKLILPGDKTIQMGFSMDRNYILSLHIYDCGTLDKEGKPKETVRRLTNIYDLLGGLLYSTEED